MILDDSPLKSEICNVKSPIPHFDIKVEEIAARFGDTGSDWLIDLPKTLPASFL
jgi:hypothetical protein